MASIKAVTIKCDVGARDLVAQKKEILQMKNASAEIQRFRAMEAITLL